LLGCTGKNKAKTAVSVAVEAKPGVMAATQNINFLTLVSYSLLQTVLAKTYRFATIQNVTDDRQMTHCAKGVTDSAVGQK